MVYEELEDLIGEEFVVNLAMKAQRELASGQE